MSKYTEFFLRSKSNIVQLELLEVTHPSFTKAYRIVRNAALGVTATIDGTPQVFDYYPLKITANGARDNLDYSLRIDVGDMGSVIPAEIDEVAADDSFSTRPQVRYWTFSSDDLVVPLFGPITLEVPSFTFKREGSSFVAQAPRLNDNLTGEVYRLDRFPMLRGFL